MSEDPRVDDVPGLVRWLDGDEAATWRNWLVLSARVRAAVGRDLARDHAMSEAEYLVLVNLSQAPERQVRMSELAARLDWSRSRLSHLIGRMETRGLVARIDCAEDGRSSFAALTALGLAEITQAAPSHVASVRRHFVDLLERDQLLQLRALTAGILERLEVAAAGGCSPAAADCAAAAESCSAADSCAPAADSCEAAADSCEAAARAWPPGPTRLG